MKSFWITASQLIDFLGGRIKSKTTILEMAKKNNWQTRKGVGLGGERIEILLSSLPSNLLKQIVPKWFDASVFDAAFYEVKAEAGKAPLLCFSLIISRVCKNTRLSKTEVVKRLTVFAENKQISDALFFFLLSLKRKEGKTDNFYFLKDILKKQRKEKKTVITDKKQQILKSQNRLIDFLSFYQDFRNPSIALAYRNYKTNQELKGLDFLSESQVRRLLKKLPAFVKERGRKTGQEMLSLRAYKKRNYEGSLVNTEWIGDGHALHCKIKHPQSGRAVRPELTLILDTTSRFCVGYSLADAESGLAVAEALYNSMVKHGLPCSYYSDNGAGQTNELLDNPKTGILRQLFIDHNLSIPGRPQSRGGIERVMRSLAKNIAIRMPTYFAEEADQNTIRKNLYYANSATKAFNEGKELNKRQQKALANLPSKEDLIKVIEEEIYKYNHKIHKSLKRSPAEVYEEGIEELISLDLHSFLVPEELNEYFKISYIRNVDRGWITYRDNVYFSQDLEIYNKQKVICRVSINNAEFIDVYELKSQKFICSAKFKGNSIEGKPKSYVEMKVADRQKNRFRLIENKRRQIIEESRNLIDVENQNKIFEILANATASNDAKLSKDKEKKERDRVLNVLLGTNS